MRPALEYTSLIVIVEGCVNRTIETMVLVSSGNWLELRIPMCFSRFIEVLALLEVWDQVIPTPAFVTQSLPRGVVLAGSANIHEVIYCGGTAEHFTPWLGDGFTICARLGHSLVAPIVSFDADRHRIQDRRGDEGICTFDSHYFSMIDYRGGK